MVRRAWMGLPLLLAVLAGRAAAQEDFSLSVQDRNLVLDMKNGKKPVTDAGGAVPAESQRALDAAANFCMMRITSEVNRHLKPGQVEKIGDLLQGAALFMLEVPAPPKKISDNQKDYIQAFGKACVAKLRTVFGTPAKPSNYELRVRLNGAQLLALVAKSGYEGCADLASELIDNPKESDAVRLYALQAMRNLFAAVNPDAPEKSMVTKPERELKAVQSLIGVIGRKPPISLEAPAEQIQALSYVRREAIRALGHVRKPAFRQEQMVVASPALVLLKVASSDPAIVPPPNVSERVEALVGYLQLIPDRQENMDYAVFFLAHATVDLAKEYNAKQPLPVIEPKEKPKTDISVSQRDYYAWKSAGLRLEVAFKDWKAAWDTENPGAPQPAAQLIADLVAKVNQIVYTPMQQTVTKSVEESLIDSWWKSQLDAGAFANAKSLFKDDPNATIVLPNQ